MVPKLAIPLELNLDQAKVYDEQMTKMVKLNFCQKLSEDKVNNYKGPVHYILHHTVVRPDKKACPSVFFLIRLPCFKVIN